VSKVDNWSRFVREGLLLGEDTNVKHPFQKMCKKFGLCYINYLNPRASSTRR